MANARRSGSGPWPWLLLALVILLLDQVTKLAVLKAFGPAQIKPITSFFNLVLVYNKGAAFSMLAQAGGWQRWFFTAIGIGATIFIVILLFRHTQQKLFCLALALILGGAVGNVIDRVMYGHVVDFLDFHYAGIHFPAFNVADCGITVGAGLLILDEILRVIRRR